MRFRPLLTAVGLTVLPVLLLVQCKTIPTSVLLQIEKDDGLSEPDELRLFVFEETGAVVLDQRLPGGAAEVKLPGQVVLFPTRDDGILGILVRALKGGNVTGEGVTQVTLVARQQVSATVLLRPGRLPDTDGDGIPDAIDSCPSWPNPKQGPCSGSDGGADGAADLGPDRGLDLGPTDLDPDLLDANPVPDLAKPDLAPGCPSSCTLGCKAGSSSCRVMVPSNGYSVGSYISLPSVTGEASIDTTTCLLTAGAVTTAGTLQKDAKGDTACVFGVSKLQISGSGKVTATGDHPLVFLVKVEVEVNGLLDAGGHKGSPGPGGGKGGVIPAGGPGVKGSGPGGGEVCACTAVGQDDCGGGGGGHGSAGAAGGGEGTACTSVSSGGLKNGAAGLVPLIGGSGGASGNQVTATREAGDGGGGGGALQISCQGLIKINGSINVGGGGGLGGPMYASNSAGGGGGGSGGAILLEATSFTGGPKGFVAVNGGGGGGGAGNPYTTTGGDGNNGGPSSQAANGGAAVSANCGAGGAGGTGSMAPKAGGIGVAQQGGGGGGGGAAGRIRFNWYQHTSKAPVQSSGFVTTGEVVVQ